MSPPGALHSHQPPYSQPKTKPTHQTITAQNPKHHRPGSSVREPAPNEAISTNMSIKNTAGPNRHPTPAGRAHKPPSTRTEINSPQHPQAQPRHRSTRTQSINPELIATGNMPPQTSGGRNTQPGRRRHPPAHQHANEPAPPPAPNDQPTTDAAAQPAKQKWERVRP